MPISRTPIPHKARRRPVTPWRLSISRELTVEEMQAIVSEFLGGTRYHYVLSGDVYPGLTMIIGDYWGTHGRAKDLAAVATLWDQVADGPLGELVVDAVLEYRVPNDLLDPLPDDGVMDKTDLTQA